MLEQPDFVDGRFHTAYLDEVLRARAGQPFTTPDEERTEVAVIAAAIAHLIHPPNLPHSPLFPASNWKARARAEGLRR
jgi:hypothetical protein